MSYIVAIISTGIAMLIFYAVISFIADIVIVLLGLGAAILVASFASRSGKIEEIIVFSLLAGIGAALVSLPIVPFSHIFHGIIHYHRSK